MGASMNRKGLGITVLLGLCVFADGRSSAQEPSATATFQPQTGQAVFLVAVRGDCGRAGARTIVNGMEVLLPFPSAPPDDRPTLDRSMPMPKPSERTAPDPEVRKDTEGEL